MRRKVEAARSLGALQSWMQARIVAPQESRPSVRALSASSGEWITPTSQLSADERVSIYANMYGYRMHDALAEDYPAVRALLGEERFARLVRAYVARFPSRSPSLQDLSLRVPEFLAMANVPRRAMLADVARVELAILRAQLAPNVEPLSRERVAAFPPEEWPLATLVLAPHVQRLELDFDASNVVTAARRGEALPSFRARTTYTLAWRRDWIVWRRDVDAATYVFLATLARGRTLTAATREARRAHAATRADATVRAGSAARAGSTTLAASAARTDADVRVDADPERAPKPRSRTTSGTASRTARDAARSNDFTELDARLQTAFGEWLGEGFFTDVRATSPLARRSARRT